MMLGMYGPYAVGKTTFIDNLINDIAMSAYNYNEIPHGLVLVKADQNLEWSKATGYIKTGMKYTGTSVAKRSDIHNMVADDTCLWIVESARYFSGSTQQYVVDAVQYSKGGAAFIIPTTTEANMIAFLKERCLKRNKAYRADVWENKTHRAGYESRDRYRNAALKWYQPNNIPWVEIIIDAERKAWAQVLRVVWQAIQRPVNQWYTE